MTNDGLRAAVRQLCQLMGARAERDRLTDRQLLDYFARQHYGRFYSLDGIW